MSQRRHAALRRCRPIVLLPALVAASADGLLLPSSAARPRRQTPHGGRCHPMRTAAAWSCEAIIDSSSSAVILRDISSRREEVPQSAGGIGVVRGGRRVSASYDLSSPREWMEYIEATEHPPSAYTVLRCDLLSDGTAAVNKGGDGSIWKVWGEEFHIDRIASSSLALLSRDGTGGDNNAAAGQPCIDKALDAAVATSRAVLRALLLEAESVLSHSDDDDERNASGDAFETKIVMITLLWTLSQPDIDTDIDCIPKGSVTIRGHAFSSGVWTNPFLTKNPITASVAIPPLNASTRLPNRHEDRPYAKLSQWCRIRRPLEDPARYKPPGVGEVLLSRRVSPDGSATSVSGEEGNIELLEGLVSNLFVVYNDGTLRTAGQELVLGGYMRHLIIDAAPACGLTVLSMPATVQDARDGQWSEAFVTSSIRLVVPIERILIPRYSGAGGTVLRWDELWSADEKPRQQVSWDSPRWEAMRKHILEKGLL